MALPTFIDGVDVEKVALGEFFVTSLADIVVGTDGTLETKAVNRTDLAAVTGTLVHSPFGCILRVLIINI